MKIISKNLETTNKTLRISQNLSRTTKINFVQHFFTFEKSKI